MDPSVAHYQSLFEEADSLYDESTVLVVQGATVAEVGEALGGVPPDEVPPEGVDADELTWATYTLVAVEGGVLAMEDTGYADPPNAVLVSLSSGGRAAAVVRDNIQAHSRFGCARDGELLFDADEYTFLDDRSGVPEELRPLFDLAWVDLAQDDADAEVDDPMAVGLAMAEAVTGIRLTAEDAERLEGEETTVLCVPPLQYAEEWDRERAR